MPLHGVQTAQVLQASAAGSYRLGLSGSVSTSRASHACTAGPGPGSRRLKRPGFRARGPSRANWIGVAVRGDTWDVPGDDDTIAEIRAKLETQLGPVAGGGEVELDSGLVYRTRRPVLIRLARRGRRYDLSDDGTAVSLSGNPPGWLESVQRLVAAEGFNVNRGGVISVPAVEGRDIATLVSRLALTSRTAYLTLLELDASVR